MPVSAANLLLGWLGAGAPALTSQHLCPPPSGVPAARGQLSRRSAYETTSEASLRLPTVDEEDDQPDHCEAGADEELCWAAVSGDVDDPAHDQDDAHYDGHPREYVPKRVRS